MQYFRHLLMAAVLAALTACGGDDGADVTVDSGIFAEPTTVSFQAVQNTATPAAQTLVIRHDGGTITQGLAPGVPQPAWLTITNLGAVNGGTAYRLNAAAPSFAPQTLIATLRFTSSGNGTGVVDVPVFYAIGANPLTISAQPQQLAFNAAAGGTKPAGQTITLNYSGASSQVNGASVPNWLQVTPTSAGASPQSYTLTPATAGLPAGVLTANVEFITRNADGSVFNTVTVPVTYTLFQAFAVQVPAIVLQFAAIDGAGTVLPAAGHTIRVLGDNINWTATTNQPWLKLSVASGSAPADVVVVVDPAALAGLPRGTYTGNVSVTDSVSGGTALISVSLGIRAARLVTAPASLNFEVGTNTPAAALTQTVTVTDELGGTQPAHALAWTLDAVESAPNAWLKWTPASGNSVPASTGSASLDPAMLATLPKGTYQGKVRLRFGAAAGDVIELPVTLTLNLPQVEAVSYYVGTENVAGTVRLRGKDFDLVPSGTVQFGATAATATVVENAVQAAAAYPALAAGRYRVQFQNAAGIPRGTAELLVMAPVPTPYKVINVPDERTQLIYDGERRSLYTVNPTDQAVNIYRYSSENWVAGPSVTVPNVRSAALSRDGKKLVVAAAFNMYEIDLTQPTLTAVIRAANPDANCGGFLQHVAMAVDGLYYVIRNQSSCTTPAPSYLYNPDTDKLTEAASSGTLHHVTQGLAASPLDGGRVLIGSNGLTPPLPLVVYNPAAGNLLESSLPVNLSAIAINREGARLLINNTQVYNAGLTLLGNLPTNGAATISPDGARAYVYASNGTQNFLQVFDLTATPDTTTGAYPALATVALPDNPGPLATARLLVSPDNRTLFISGADRILVIQL